MMPIGEVNLWKLWQPIAPSPDPSVFNYSPPTSSHVIQAITQASWNPQSVSFETPSHTNNAPPWREGLYVRKMGVEIWSPASPPGPASVKKVFLRIQITPNKLLSLFSLKILLKLVQIKYLSVFWISVTRVAREAGRGVRYSFAFFQKKLVYWKMEAGARVLRDLTQILLLLAVLKKGLQLCEPLILPPILC